MSRNRPAPSPTVPEEARKPVSKGVLALALIEEVRAAGRQAGTAAVAAEETYSRESAEALPTRGLTLAGGNDHLVAALERYNDLRTGLGLDHSEGRTWTGWHHHVSLVFTADTFRASELLTGPAARR